MAGIVLAFAGPTSSGKTTLTNAIGHAFGWPRVGFGDYVRYVASSRGLDQSRETLQAIGAELIQSGTNKFCQAVLEQADWTPGESLIVDGVRHAQIITELQKLVFPSALNLVFIEVDERTRFSRLARDGLTSQEQIAAHDRHSTEVQVNMELRSIADLHIDGTASPEAVTEELLRFVSSLS